MAKEFSRGRRVGEQIRRELAQLIQQEIKDPRLGMVSVSAVEVSRDMAHAKVYVSALAPQGGEEEVLAVLRHAGGFLRRELGRRLSLRVTPELRFAYDSSIEQGSRLSDLIDRAVAKDRNSNED